MWRWKSLRNRDKNPEAICIGLEISPLLWRLLIFETDFSLFRTFLFERKYFQEDLSKADVLYVLGEESMKKHRKNRFGMQKNKKGQRLLSYHFPLPKTPFTRKDGGEDQQEATIYEYVR